MHVYKVQEVPFGIITSSVFITLMGTLNITDKLIDTRLLDEQEYDDLLERLREESISEDSIKMYRKYTALKHITN